MRVEQAGSAHAPAVVLANSLAADLSMWDPQARDLARNYRVIRYDMRGHGGSSSTPGDYSLSLLADDVLALMDRLSVRKAHFIGLSLGGMVGQLLGAKASERLESLTLCATFAEAPRQLWADRVEAVRKGGVGPLVGGTLERWFTPDFRQTSPQVVEAVGRMVAATSVDGYAGCAAAIRDMDLTGVPERITVPTLVLSAAQDPSAPPQVMKDLHARIRSARYAEIEGAAHLFTLEQPAATGAHFASFLNSIQQDAAQTPAAPRQG